MGLVIIAMIAWSGTAGAESAPLSEATEACLECHASVTPGIVEDWKKSRHFLVSPAEALKKEEIERRISAESIPSETASFAVGCAECHLLNPESHKDTFEHEGENVHIVVSPADCAKCHPKEAAQYNDNKMAWAYPNLMNNELYGKLRESINGQYSYKAGVLSNNGVPAGEDELACLSCHGTEVKVTGVETRETDYGDFDIPVLSGWPNQGVGRINPDGSRGSCTSCHTRHQFSIKTARKPYTCAQCHKGPDVPAYKIYSVSKHGGLFASHQDEWNFSKAAWTVGEDFTAPTCATCHVSLLVDKEGEVIAERTHRMNDRLPWRLFGLVYSHPQPVSPDTSRIRNSDGIPLPTGFDGKYAAEYLISREEMENRAETMKGVCQACHSRSWVDGHWDLFEKSLKSSDAGVMSATNIIGEAWKTGLVKGPAENGSPFDEPLEKKWIEQWLFYANSMRLAAAMGGADYGVFEGGRWNASKNLVDMAERLELYKKLNKKDDSAKKRD